MPGIPASPSWCPSVVSHHRSRTLSALSWSGAAQAVRQLLFVVFGIALARLLTPRDFGLLAMVTVFTGFAGVFADFGFGSALIQNRKTTERHYSSVFWLNALIGVALTALFALAAPLLARFYGEPVLIPLTVFTSLHFLIGSVNYVQRSLLARELDFRTLSMVEMIGVAGAGVLGVALALAGFGVWSLAARYVATPLIIAILLWYASAWRPRLIFSMGAVRELFGFSASLFGTQSFNYWVNKLDRLLIGRILGSGPLGIYDKAYQLMLGPLNDVAAVIGRVMFPSLSHVQDDRERVKLMVLRGTRAIGLVTFPALLGVLVTADVLVLALLGDAWVEMVPVLRVLCIAGLGRAVMTLTGSLYLSQGRATLQFLVMVPLKLVLVVGIVVGIAWGVIGVAAGYAVASLLITYPSFRYAGRLVGLTYGELLRHLSPVFFSAAAMAAAVWGAGLILPEGWSPWAALGVQVATGIAAYALILETLRIEAYLEVRGIVLEQIRRARGGSARS